MNLSDLREEYQQQRLCKSDLLAQPLQQLKKWLNEAKQPLANACLLATANQMGRVSSRVVLIQSIENNMLYFYSNYHSQKAQDIAKNNQVSLSFVWYSLARQVHLCGCVHKTTSVQSKQYFATRPRNSQLAAWASSQSQPIKNRALLEERYRFYRQKFANQIIPCPDFWGGYQFSPEQVEFWQGGRWRLHDRFLYQKQKDHWQITRLAP